MKGYGWQSGAAGGLGALAEILGQFRQTKIEREREERSRLDRATERRQDMTELQLREAGAGSRNIADNARAERVAKMNIDAAEKRAADERQRKLDLDREKLRAAINAAATNPRAPKDLLERYQKGEFNALDPDQVAAYFVTPYARDYDREDRQQAARDLKKLGDALADGNRREPRVRPTEKAAFADKMWNSFRGTGRAAGEFWDFLGELGAGDADDAARLGMTRNDYRAVLQKDSDKAKAAREKKEKEEGKGGGFVPQDPPPKKVPSRPAPQSGKADSTKKKKSYEDILGPGR